MINLIPTEQDLAKYRPVPFYFITTRDPEELTYEKAYESLSRLKSEGFGGIVLFNKPPHGFDRETYLSDAWYEMVKNFVHACADLKLRVWLNDGFDFPPGSAAGRINRQNHPELTQKRLRLIDGKVATEDVEWGFPAFEYPESAQLFEEIVYEGYRKAVGEYFGNTIEGIFSDCDNRRVDFHVFFDDRYKDYFPWSDNFAETFEKAYGYDIEPHLESILKKEFSKAAHDYWEHSGTLFQSWFVANHKWCREHGLKYTFHTTDCSPTPWEEAPRSQIYTEGRALTHEGNADFPGTDQELLEINGGKHVFKGFFVPKVCWNGDDSGVRGPEYRIVYGDLRAKTPASAAFLKNRDGAMCEMFAASNWGATPTDAKEIAAWQIMQGITFVVPHAYHYRLCGETKYFAPPDFSTVSYMNKAVKKLNDTIAAECYYADLGNLAAPVAVLDLTDDIWEGWKDNKKLFDVCEKLNRLPYGYVLADAKSILDNRDRFKVVVNTGAPLAGERKELLEKSGLPVITADEFDSKLTDYVNSEIAYIGEGHPHFMRRLLDDGSELILLASIEEETVIKGELTWGETKIPVHLETGEIAFFTRDGQLCKPETTEKDEVLAKLPEIAAVSYSAPNIVPIECWIDDNGNTVTKDDEASRFSFEFEMTRDIESIQLLISDRDMPLITSVIADGEKLSESGKEYVFADEHSAFTIMGAGLHKITIEKTAPLFIEDRILLSGEFDAAVTTAGRFYKMCGEQYSLERYIPQKNQVLLMSRRGTMSTKLSFAEQGQPFYSGSVTYHMDVDLPQIELTEGKRVFLGLGEVRDIAEVTVNGKALGSRCWKPYAFDMTEAVKESSDGRLSIDVTVTNTFANAMEFYRAPSGLLSGGEIYTAQ